MNTKKYPFLLKKAFTQPAAQQDNGPALDIIDGLGPYSAAAGSALQETGLFTLETYIKLKWLNIKYLQKGV